MATRTMSESGYYHIVIRSAGQVALFEDDADRRKYLKLLKSARDEARARVIAWVLMTDHVHLVVDFGERPAQIADFMLQIDSRYSRYFNAKTGREGTLFQGTYWSKPITTDEQLVATVHYVHMNPEMAGLAPMCSYHWSSYQEYAGTHWVVDTSTLLDYFGGFEQFDAYAGSAVDAVRDSFDEKNQDSEILSFTVQLAGVTTSNELRSLPKNRRNELIRTLNKKGVSGRRIARTLGIGPATVTRVLRGK